MKFTATVTQRLLRPLGTREACESTLLRVFQEAFWPAMPLANREQSILVEVPEICTIEIDVDLDLVQRDAEVVMYMLHEAMDVLLDPEYNSDIEVVINNEL